MNPIVELPNLPLSLVVFLGVSVISGCSVGAVKGWAKEHRREREAYYRSELVKRIAETHGVASALQFLNEDQMGAQYVRQCARRTGSILVKVALFCLFGRPEILQPGPSRSGLTK